MRTQRLQAADMSRCNNDTHVEISSAPTATSTIPHHTCINVPKIMVYGSTIDIFQRKAFKIVGTTEIAFHALVLRALGCMASIHCMEPRWTLIKPSYIKSSRTKSSCFNIEMPRTQVVNAASNSSIFLKKRSRFTKVVQPRCHKGQP